MLPLLMGAGRLVASQGLKQGVRSAAKNFAKDKVKDVAKKKAQSFIQNKNKKDDGGGGGLVKRDSGDGGGSGGFFGGGGGSGGSGGSLVQTKKINIGKLSLIDKDKDKEKGDKEGSKDTSFNGEELIDELTKIKNNLITIKNISSSNLSSFLSEQRNRRKEQELEKRKGKEDKLETTRDKTEKPKSIKGIKGPGFLDLLWNFISNVLLGSLVVFLLNHMPQIMKMFEEIAKGLTNTWQVIRLAIISGSVLLRKQIRFVFNLGRRILRFSAPIINKAASVVRKVLTFAGRRIVNLIRGAVGLATRLARKLAPAAARRVAPVARGAINLARKAAGGVARAGGATANAASKAVNIARRIKIVSNLFKKVPFIGALIGIGIDIALGERVDRAIAGAAGASIGAFIGGALGKGGALALTISTGGIGALAAPFIIGASGFLGSAIGDWAGKAIYDKVSPIGNKADKEAPIHQMYAAGRLAGVSSGGRVSRSSTSSPGSVVATSSSRVPPGVEENAKENVFKDDQSLATYKEIRSKLGSSSFVGELMQIGLDAGLGAKIAKSKTDNAAKQIGSSIGRALSETKVFGFNKRLIGPLTQDITEWAKKAIFNDLTKISLSKYGKSEEESSGGETPEADGGTPDAGGGGGTLPGDAPPEVKALMEAIAGGEGSWDSVNSGLKISGLSNMTIAEARETGMRIRNEDRGSGALGKWQQMPIINGVNTLKERTELAGLNYQKDKFSHENQTKITRAYLASLYGGEQKLVSDLRKDPMIAARKLKGAWPSLPGGSQENAHSKGFLERYNKNVEKYKKIASDGGGGAPDANRPAAPGSPKSGKNRKIFLHWSAGNYTTPYPAYHSIVLGNGETVKYTPYDQDKNTHTEGANKNSVGLAVAAAEGAKEENVKTPPTSKQLDVLTSQAASLAKGWGWNAATVDSNVRTHGEWERYAVPAGILPPPVQRWDLDRLSNADKFGTGGPKLRDMIKSKLSAMGGGKGNGGAVDKKHKVSEFILGGGRRTLTSGMGMRDFALSPGMHMGIDVSGKTGEPLQAFTDGVIEDVGYEADGYGNYVSWIDDKGIGHFYAHMNKPAFVKKGQRVKKGTILGELGSTGRSSAPHLHWETATKPSDNGRSKNAVLSRFNPLSKYGIDSPFGGNIQPDPSMVTSSPGAPDSPGTPGSPGAPTSDAPRIQLDPNFRVEGGKVKQFYLDALKDGSYTGPNVRSIEQETSYEQSGGNNIIMMPTPQGNSSSPVNGRVNNSSGTLVGSVNSNIDIYNGSLKQVIVSSFYKI